MASHGLGLPSERACPWGVSELKRITSHSHCILVAMFGSREEQPDSILAWGSGQVILQSTWLANFGKYNLSHHLFSFGIGNQIELSFSFASLNTAARSSTQSSIFLSSMLSLRLSSGITEINEKTLFPWGVHRWVEMNNEDPM